MTRLKLPDERTGNHARADRFLHERVDWFGERDGTDPLLETLDLTKLRSRYRALPDRYKKAATTGEVLLLVGEVLKALTRLSDEIEKIRKA
jgi:hypothetical protein